MLYTADQFVDELVRRGWTPEKLASLLDRLDNFTSAFYLSTSEPSPVIFETEKSVKNRIAKFLLDVGIPTGINGFNFLITAIYLEMQNTSGKPLPITGTIYPTVAKEHSTTRTSVERDIRKAIEVGCNAPNRRLHKLAGSIMSQKGTLENYKFINFAAFYLKQQTPSALEKF